ncbi:unnamed protein product, partial [Polarella glacialis]
QVILWFLAGFRWVRFSEGRLFACLSRTLVMQSQRPRELTILDEGVDDASVAFDVSRGTTPAHSLNTSRARTPEGRGRFSPYRSPANLEPTDDDRFAMQRPRELNILDEGVDDASIAFDVSRGTTPRGSPRTTSKNSRNTSRAQTPEGRGSFVPISAGNLEPTDDDLGSFLDSLSAKKDTRDADSPDFQRVQLEWQASLAQASSDAPVDQQPSINRHQSDASRAIALFPAEDSDLATNSAQLADPGRQDSKRSYNMNKTLGDLDNQRQRQANPENIGPCGIYHEKQVGSLCALHCVNNLLQGPRVTEDHLRQTAEQLDEAELRLTGGRALDYGNARKNGNYNIQVVQIVLSGLGFQMQSTRGVVEVRGETGFIINKAKHWFTLRKLGNEWFDLNSFLDNPEHYTPTSLQEHITDVQNQGYHIFTVRGTFPATPLDEDPALLDTAILLDSDADNAKVTKKPEIYKPNAALMFLIDWFNGGDMKVRQKEQKKQIQESNRVKSAEKAKETVRDQSILGNIISRLDADGDGIFDVSDLDDLVAADIEDGFAVEDNDNHWPIFCALQVALALLLWLVMAVKEHSGDGAFNFLQELAGLETLVPGQTSVLVYRDCVSHRWDVWRWFSYQFTHGNFTHIGMNCFIILVAGCPLEAFQGTLRTMIFFNLGVMSGALTSMVWNIHAELVGMSAGCYALLLAHISELVLNWRHTKFRWVKLLLLLVVIGVDTANVQLTQVKGAHKAGDLVVSHSAHVAGGITGLLGGIIIGRNLVLQRRERCIQLVAVLLLAGFYAYHLSYVVTQWPPQSSVEPEAWCWVRQVWNVTRFGDEKFHCVKCATDDCISRWSAERWIKAADFDTCLYTNSFSEAK